MYFASFYQVKSVYIFLVFITVWLKMCAKIGSKIIGNLFSKKLTISFFAFFASDFETQKFTKTATKAIIPIKVSRNSQKIVQILPNLDDKNYNSQNCYQICPNSTYKNIQNCQKHTRQIPPPNSRRYPESFLTDFFTTNFRVSLLDVIKIKISHKHHRHKNWPNQSKIVKTNQNFTQVPALKNVQKIGHGVIRTCWSRDVAGRVIQILSKKFHIINKISKKWQK